MRYLSFIRGINVGGKNVIPMQELKQVFIAAELKNVETYIQSGNVKFETEETDISSIKSHIENNLFGRFGTHITVMLRTYEEIRHLVILNPFAKFSKQNTDKQYISFLNGYPAEFTPVLPITNIKEGLELISIEKMNAFVTCHKHDGKYGFPNLWIEKIFSTYATTRNWNTIEKIINIR
jgi:uncharacterized protein (DUF1697 family)